MLVLYILEELLSSSGDAGIGSGDGNDDNER